VTAAPQNIDSSARLALGSSIEHAAVVFALAAFAWLLVLHGAMVTTEAPMEMRDGAMLATTAALLQGRNPYAIPGFIESGNVYGIGYPLVVVPFAWVLGPGFATHRLVAAFGILGAALIVFSWLRRAHVLRIDALLATGLVYAGFIYYTGAAARPDGVGVFLMLAAIEAMRRDDLGTRGYVGGLALSLLGFVCKIYFVWPAFAAAAYVFLCRDWRRGLVYGLAAIVATAATIVTLSALLPGYAALVLLANIRASDYQLSYLLRQIGDWALFELPLLAAGLVLLARALARGSRPNGRDIGLFAAMTVLSAIALVFCLGGDTGAHLSYFFELLSPFATVAIMVSAARQPIALRVFRFALPVAVLLNAHWFPLDPRRFAAAEATFAQLRTLIDGSRQVLASTEFAGVLALQDRPLTATGHARYFVYGFAGEPPFLLKPLLPPASTLEAEWERHRGTIRRGIEQRRYDLALTDPAPGPLIPLDLLAERYRKEGAITIDMPWALQTWPIQVWRPGN